MSTLTIYTDGGARGNPGPAAVGVHMLTEAGFDKRHGRTIGDTTNNVAEYTAVLDALEIVESLEITGEQPISKLQFFLDSELVVKQLTGMYRIKEPSLQELASKILIRLKASTLSYTFTHIPRAKNKVADSLVNAALDGTL
jgi:ribonuclease HI